MDTIFEKMGLFYLGKDSSDDTLELYKSKHLTTHAAIIGMTGSGKTGLGIGIIEEAAIDNIPSIIIDPKGDMGNLCLDFPNMNPSDFIPYIDPIAAQNKNLSIEEFAKITAQKWKDGIESFGQDLTRVKKLSDVKKTIYTPGSSAGVGVNILGNFNAPNTEILDDSDLFSSLINSTVTSLLSLVGIDANPISSKEHLLLSNIFNFYWSKGKSLSLEDLIGYIATPPFKKIGVLTLKSFYPQNERMKLAMLLNNVISSVTFSSWIRGEALDIQNMLYDEKGKAKISIFSIAHLNDNERMFFVTILLNAYINWMRAQRGSSILKSLIYMDEIFGFFPPTKNPPSKEPMLLLLKQARAFGTGIVLSTQNPVEDIFLKLELRDDVKSINWKDSVEDEEPQFTSKANSSAKYASLPDIILGEKNLNTWKKELSDFIYNTKRLELYSCKALKIESKNGQSKQDFMLEIQDILKEKEDEKIEKIKSRFQAKYDRLQDKLQRLEFKLEKEKSDVTTKATDTFIGIGMTVLGAIFGRKALSASTISRGASAIKKGKSVLTERNDVKNTIALMDNVKEDISNLQDSLQDEIDKTDNQFNINNYEISDIAIKPRRSDVCVEDIAVLWER